MFLWRTLEPWKLAALLARLTPAQAGGDSAVSPAKPAASEGTAGASVPTTRPANGR
jgi:hypothetical protein